MPRPDAVNLFSDEELAELDETERRILQYRRDEDEYYQDQVG